MRLDGAFTVLLLLIGGVSAGTGEFDFPPVNLNVKDSGVTVSFTHPLLFYRQLKPADEDTFIFNFSSDVGQFDGFCTDDKDDCKLDISFPEGVEKCVSLKGSLIDRNHFGDVVFRETGRICLSAAVLPPTNVTLSCPNVNVTVSWEHGEQHARTRFRVHIGGSAGHHVSETTDRQYDLSHFVWASEERYLGFHYVTVTAIEGGDQSESVTSKTFTFNKLKLAQISCEVDFPPVDLNEKDSGATLSFANPLHFYRELKQAVKPDTTNFKFTNSSDGDLLRRLQTCTAEQEICKQDISFPEDVEKCVRLKGWLNAGNNVGKVVFRETGRICASTSTELHAVTLTIMLFVLGILIVVITIVICKVKAWTMKVPSLPKPLLPDHMEGVLMYAPVPRADISQLTVSKPCKNPSVSSEEEEENDLTENLQDSSVGSDVRPPAGSYTKGELSEEYGKDDDSADDSVKTETVWIDLDEGVEDEVSPYDCPHTLQVDMGDGDMVTGYSTR